MLIYKYTEIILISKVGFMKVLISEILLKNIPKRKKEFILPKLNKFKTENRIFLASKDSY